MELLGVRPVSKTLMMLKVPLVGLVRPDREIKQKLACREAWRKLGEVGSEPSGLMHILCLPLIQKRGVTLHYDQRRNSPLMMCSFATIPNNTSVPPTTLYVPLSDQLVLSNYTVAITCTTLIF